MNILLRSYPTSTTDSAGIFGALLVIYAAMFLVGTALSGLFYMGIFKKAGRPAWASYVPVYNRIVLLEIVGRPWWWLFLAFVPIAGLVTGIIVLNDLALSFRKDTAYTIGLFFLGFVFVPMLSYGQAQYAGPAGAPQPGWPQPGHPYNQGQFQVTGQPPYPQQQHAPYYSQQPAAPAPDEPTPPVN